MRPAGAGHETLYVWLLCLLILTVAGSIVVNTNGEDPVNELQTTAEMIVKSLSKK